MNGSVKSDLVKRSALVLLMIVVIFLLLLFRVLLLQTVDFERYQEKVLDQLTVQTVVKADRGVIYDTNGTPIATNITTYRVFISPSGIQSAQKELDGSASDSLARLISEGLSSILGLDYDFVLKQTTYTKYLDRTISRRVYDEKAAEVRAFIAEHELEDMIYLQANTTRYYPYESLGSSILGFTSYDGAGLYGLELQYEEELCGTDGYYIVARDSSGNELPNQYESYLPAVDGNSLHTTIDVHVQAALEEQLMNTLTESNALNRACGIVMDVKTGAILAMATAPGFDLNDAWTLNEYYQNKLDKSGLASNSEEYDALQRNYMLEMWSNKAITDSYIPGSTFKIITSSMVLSEQVVDLNSSFFCGGSLHVSGHTIHCHKLTGHGSLNFAQGLQQSCNVVYMTVGQKLGTTAFKEYFRAFGYKEKTGIDLPGEGGSIFPAELTNLDLAIYAFGQNFNVTPIQQICAVAAVANGGYLVTPYLVERVVDANGKSVYEHTPEIKRQVIGADVSRTLTTVLEEGVSGDGGAKNAYVAGYRIAAKTGTSEKKGGNSSVERYICSCVAFAPADDPQYAAIIMVDEPTAGNLYGSTVAAPYISGLMEEILPYLGVEPVYTEEEQKKLAIKVPDYSYFSVANARYYAEERGFEVEFVGDGSFVKSQVPAAGSTVEKASGKIVFYTGDAKPVENIVVPDLVGKTAAAANGILISAGLNIKIEGTKNYLSGTGATVISQSPAAGESVSAGTVVTVEFRYLDENDLY